MDEDEVLREQQLNDFLERLPKEIALARSKGGRVAELAVVLSGDYFCRLWARGYGIGSNGLPGHVAMIYGLPIAVVGSRHEASTRMNGVALVSDREGSIYDEPFARLKLVRVDDGYKLFELVVSENMTPSLVYVYTGYTARFHSASYTTSRQRRRGDDEMWWNTTNASSTYVTDYYFSNTYTTSWLPTSGTSGNAPKAYKIPVSEDRFSVEDTQALDEFLDSIKVAEQP